MTAAQTAQALGLDANAVAAFTGSKKEFAQHFGVDATEAPASAPVATAPLAPPTPPVAAAGAAGEVIVTFTALTGADTGGSPITGYEIVVGNGAPVAATASPKTITGVAAGDVAVRYRAVNAVGKGPLSAASNIVTVT